MIKSGDLVFYPMQGAGIVKDKEVHGFAEQRQEYYQVFFPLNKLNILIPRNKVSEIGIRPLATPELLDQSRAHFFDKSMDLPIDPTKRRCLLQDKIKSGSLVDEMEIIRDLVCSEKDKFRFSHYDRNILELSCRMLISEMMYVEDISYEFAKQIVDEDIEIRVSGDEKYFYKLTP